jgi:SagB-type dehydrogenase family enzyme
VGNRLDHTDGNDFSSAIAYHESTKHSEVSINASAHYLDWDTKPSPFKEYLNLPSIALPRNFPRPEENSIGAIRGELRNAGEKQIGLEVLAEILFFSAGLTRKMRFGREFYYMRAASATGALYPIEVYVISAQMPGLEAGVYHFNPLHFSLVTLREGDYRSALNDAGSPGSLSAPFTLVFTSIAWRNAWKYEARSYRHWFWDAGVIVANLLATSNSAGIDTRIELGFVDSKVDRLLGLEPRREATVALAVVGSGKGRKATETHEQIPSLAPKIRPLSSEETDYPIIWETNETSQLKSESDAQLWKKTPIASKRPDSSATLTFLLKDPKPASYQHLDEAILRRGSTRKFSHQPITFSQLSTIIQSSETNVPVDFLQDGQSVIDFYFIANDVEGLSPGSYFYNANANSVEQLKAVKNRSMSGYLCLGQQLFSDASVVFFLMTDLARVLRSLGNRGYRAAQFEAGIRAGKIYLSSYAVGIGASGSTFFDDAVTEFFSPHAKAKSPMIAVGVGVPAYKARSGRILPQMTQKPEVT